MANNTHETHIHHDRPLWKDIAAIVLTVLITLIASSAIRGLDSVSRADAQSMIQDSETKTDAKILTMSDKLNEMSIDLAQISQKLDDLKYSKGGK